MLWETQLLFAAERAAMPGFLSRCKRGPLITSWEPG
jgi:hypothetical protein